MIPTMRDRAYLDYLRRRPCSFCGKMASEPHHSIRQFLGVSTGGVGRKGSDYLAVPACRSCHRKIHDGTLRAERIEILEMIVVNLTCFVAWRKSRHQWDSHEEQS
jgi:hypothetical protein